MGKWCFLDAKKYEYETVTRH